MSTSVENLGVAEHTALLGEVVTWDMATIEVPLQSITDALSASGLSDDQMADLRPETAFSRAVKELREGRTIDRVTKDHKTNTMTFQFTRKHLNAKGIQIDFAYEAICHLNTATGEITCPESPEIGEHARKMFDHAVNHRNTSDVTRLVQRMFAAHADLYPINPRKGVAYFVPEAHRDFTSKIEEFLNTLGGRLLRFPVPKGTAVGNRAVKTAVEEGLEALAAELEEAVETWNENTRETTFDKAIAKWQTIKHKAEAYSEYLGDRQAVLLAKLDEQKRRLAAKVAEISMVKDHGPAATASSSQPAEKPLPLFPGATAPIATGPTADPSGGDFEPELESTPESPSHIIPNSTIARRIAQVSDFSLLINDEICYPDEVVRAWITETSEKLGDLTVAVVREAMSPNFVGDINQIEEAIDFAIADAITPEDMPCTNHVQLIFSDSSEPVTA